MIRATIGLLSLLLLASPLAAQSGALFLVLPFGARAVGQGEAVVADSALGTEALWWNPAGAARGSKREITVHHSKTFGATSDMIALMLPSRLLGTVSAAFYLVNYGDLPVTPREGEVQIGTASTHNYMGALSYASTVGSRFSAGLTYKFLMLRFACSGVCGDIPVYSGSTSALDMGAQYLVPAPIPLMFGASIRNLGPALPVKDNEQADPLPRTFQLGVRAQLPMEFLKRSQSSLEVMADYKRVAAVFDGAAGGVGAVLGYRDEFFLRTGYHFQPGGGSGPALGVGAVRGDLSVDLGMRFDEFSSQIGETPTYISLRVRF